MAFVIKVEGSCCQFYFWQMPQGTQHSALPTQLMMCLCMKKFLWYLTNSLLQVARTTVFEKYTITTVLCVNMVAPATIFMDDLYKLIFIFLKYRPMAIP